MTEVQLNPNEQSSFSVSGVLAVHVKAIKLADEEAGISLANHLFLKLTVGDQQTKVPIAKANSQDYGDVNVWLISDSLRHFSIEMKVPSLAGKELFNEKYTKEEEEEEKYNLKIELFMISPLLVTQKLLGVSKTLIIDIIQGVATSLSKDLFNENEEQVATVDLTWTFSYGPFGYGEGPQISSVHRDPVDYLKWSTFPRVKSHEDHTSIHLDDECYSLEHMSTVRPLYLTRQFMKNLPNWQLQYGAIRDRSKKLQYVKEIVRKQEIPTQRADISHMTGRHMSFLNITGITQRRV